MELTVNQTVYLLRVGNNARYYKNEQLESLIVEAKVQKVGRKYIEVLPNGRLDTIKFNKEDLKEVTNYSADWELYLSKQEIYDNEEHSDLCFEIKSVFVKYGKIDLSLEQLRKIKAIIDESK